MGAFFCAPVGLAYAFCILHSFFASTERKYACIYGLSLFLWICAFLPQLFFSDASIFIAKKIYHVYGKI